MKKYLANLTKNERLVAFILTINLIINLILFSISKNYQENHLSNHEFIDYFYPFVELRSEFLRGKYENTKLVSSFNLPEFLVYGLLPLAIFVMWLKFFKTDENIKL